MIIFAINIFSMVEILQNKCNEIIITIEIDVTTMTYLVFKSKKRDTKITKLVNFNDLIFSKIFETIIDEFYDYQTWSDKVTSYYDNLNWTDGYETEMTICEALNNIVKNKLLFRKIKLMEIND